ncbi:hypothetical protein BJX64DRAFT_260701 [Aspergillus heterothallicus]
MLFAFPCESFGAGEHLAPYLFIRRSNQRRSNHPLQGNRLTNLIFLMVAFLSTGLLQMMEGTSMYMVGSFSWIDICLICSRPPSTCFLFCSQLPLRFYSFSI